MTSHRNALLEDCIDALRKGILTEDDLRNLAGELRGRSGTQDLLYLQTATTSVTSKVIGMTMLLDGEIDDGPADPEKWPYTTVVEAITDGWRVIRFPAQLLSAHSQDGQMICEFILEK